MSRKNDRQIAEDRLRELRVQHAEQEEKLEELETAYKNKFSILEGAELEQVEEAITAQRYLVKQTRKKIDEIKSIKDEYIQDQQAAEEFKWNKIQPKVAKAIEEHHISYNVENNKYVYCMDMGKGDVVNPTFRSFDGSRAASAFSKMVSNQPLPIEYNYQIQKYFITQGHTHYQETASFLYSKWAPEKVYNKASVIREYWLEPVLDQPYHPDFDLLMYCVGGGRQENIDHLEQWIAYKYLWPERTANTPNIDLGGSPGGNGKTIVVEMAKTIFTPNCVVPAVAKELKDGFNSTWELATILHFDEPEEKELPASKMKNATGGLEQRVERKGVDAYSSDRNYNIIATSNNPLGVFKLAGTGTAGEDRRYSVINTNIPLVDEIQRRENLDVDAAKQRASAIASLVRDGEQVACWLGAKILQHDIVNLNILKPLHGQDYLQRFEDQKSTYDTVFDQLLPVFMSAGVITVKILQDIIGIIQDGKKPTPKTVKRLWKDFLNRNRVQFTEFPQSRIDIVMSGHVLSTQQSHAFRLVSDPTARQFPWDQISTAVPSRDLDKDDLLIQI
jgi:hypothetical protein